jgi:hypothetical protein
LRLFPTAARFGLRLDYTLVDGQVLTESVAIQPLLADLRLGAADHRARRVRGTARPITSSRSTASFADRRDRQRPSARDSMPVIDRASSCFTASK